MVGGVRLYYFGPSRRAIRGNYAEIETGITLILPTPANIVWNVDEFEMLTVERQLKDAI